MRKTSLFIASLCCVLLSSCKDNDDAPAAESQYEEEGFVMTSISQTTAGWSYYAGYYPTVPTGNIDLTTKSSYSYLSNLQKPWKNFIIGRPTVDENRLVKLAVSKKTGALEEAGSIQLLDLSINTLFINDELGVYTTAGNRALFLFNPTTMENLGQIDMSKAQNFPDNNQNMYSHLVYRPQDNRLFAALYTDSDKTGQFYDAVNVYVEVIDLTTRQWEKTAVFEQATYPLSRGKENQLIDESGNIYFITQGQYGLDGQLGPNAARRSKPQILKIPAGSTEFDKSYSFNPIEALGYNNLMFNILAGGIYDANGIAYACVSANTESPRLLELIGKMAAGTITAVEFGELRTIAFTSPNQRWARLDLNAQTASVISDIPLTAGYGYANAFKYDGKFYFLGYNEEIGLNGYYEYDPASMKAKKLHTLTGGGIVNGLFKLKK